MCILFYFPNRIYPCVLSAVGLDVCINLSSVVVQSDFNVSMNISRFIYNCWFKSWILLESLKDRVDPCIGGLY